MSKLLLISSLLIWTTLAQNNYYSYNYQNYPVQFDHLYHGRPANRGPLGGNTPMDNMLLQSAMRSLMKPGVDPNRRTSSTSFLKEWNQRFGYNFMSIEAIQENIGCRARCRRLTESPVCGDNKTRYFNSCDAECDQVTYNTNLLRYNKSCCCYDDQMSLLTGKVSCVVENSSDRRGTAPFMIVNKCLHECLTKRGHSLAQDNHIVVNC